LESRNGAIVVVVIEAAANGGTFDDGSVVLLEGSVRRSIANAHDVIVVVNLQPTLSQEAADAIAEEYSRLRSHEVENPDVARTQPVTARALETLIRLSTAHARARLSKVVDADDAQSAIELVQFAYFKRVLEKPRKRKNVDDDHEEEEAGTEDEVDTEEVSTIKKSWLLNRFIEPFLFSFLFYSCFCHRNQTRM